MKNSRYLFLLLPAALLMLPVGCANKKKIAREQALAEAQRVEAERQRVQDSIALAQALAEAERQRELERQRIQDSIAQAEAAKKAMVQNLYVSRMTISVNAQGKQLSTPATLRWQRGEGAQISIQPFLGMEMFRLEIDNEHMTIIDKVNRRYTRMTYDELAKMGSRTSIDDLDRWIDNNILAHSDEPQLMLQVSQAGISGSAVLYTSSMQTNTKATMRATNINGYQKVSLEQMMKGF